MPILQEGMQPCQYLNFRRGDTHHVLTYRTMRQSRLIPLSLWQFITVAVKLSTLNQSETDNLNNLKYKQIKYAIEKNLNKRNTYTQDTGRLSHILDELQCYMLSPTKQMTRQFSVRFISLIIPRLKTRRLKTIQKEKTKNFYFS